MSYIEFNRVVKEYRTGETGMKDAPKRIFQSRTSLPAQQAADPDGKSTPRIPHQGACRRTAAAQGISVLALNEASFTVEKGELAVILGASGAGKTTALNILGGMDTATSGQVIVDGEDITAFNKKQLVGYRRADIGFVFQFYNLVPNLTALENVELAVQVCRNHLDPLETMQKVGLAERTGNFPAQLSGGEQQRVSIARAMAKNPKLLLCDEPTGALDYVTGKQVLQLLQDMCRKDGITVIIITHNAAVAPMADRLIRFRSGKVIEESLNSFPTPIEEIEW